MHQDANPKQSSESCCLASLAQVDDVQARAGVGSTSDQAVTFSTCVLHVCVTGMGKLIATIVRDQAA